MSLSFIFQKPELHNRISYCISQTLMTKDWKQKTSSESYRNKLFSWMNLVRVRYVVRQWTGLFPISNIPSTDEGLINLGSVVECSHFCDFSPETTPWTNCEIKVSIKAEKMICALIIYIYIFYNWYQKDLCQSYKRNSTERLIPKVQLMKKEYTIKFISNCVLTLTRSRNEIIGKTSVSGKVW